VAVGAKARDQRGADQSVRSGETDVHVANANGTSGDARTR
jgi:hypothetical protein